MIPAIALMVGAYIFTRMFQIFISPDKEGNQKPFIVILAAITLIITVYSVYTVMSAGASIPDF